MSVEVVVRDILRQHLQLGHAVDDYDADTPLLGAVPELDSIGVVTLITAIEDNFGCVIEDDEIDAEIFATLGSLVSFVETKA